MYEVVLDTNVLVSAFRSKRGASYALVRSVGQANWRPTISVALALEYEEVLKRSGMVLGFSENEIDDFLAYILSQAELVSEVLRRRPILPDPDDERIVEVAIASGAMIITHNTKHFAAAERYGVAIQTPSQFLGLLRRNV